MEAGTAEHAAGSTVGHTPQAPSERASASHTIADLIPDAVEAFGDRVAVRHKQDGAWQDVTYTELGEIVQEIALGLIDLGIAAGGAGVHPRGNATRSGPTSTWRRPPPGQWWCRSTRPTPPRSAIG